MCITTIVPTAFICIIIIQPFIICVQGDEVFCCVAWANGYPATLIHQEDSFDTQDGVSTAPANLPICNGLDYAGIASSMLS